MGQAAWFKAKERANMTNIIIYIYLTASFKLPIEKKLTILSA